MNKQQGEELIKELEKAKDLGGYYTLTQQVVGIARPFLKVLIDIAKSLEYISKGEPK